MLTSDKRLVLNQVPVAASQRLGEELHKTVNVVKALYSFAIQGGAVGSVNLVDSVTGLAVKLPSGAIITKSWIDVLTTPTSGGSATIALTANSAGDILAALAMDSLTGIYAGVSTGVAANMKKMTAERTLLATIAVAALTAGKFNVFVEYVLSVD